VEWVLYVVKIEPYSNERREGAKRRKSIKTTGAIQIAKSRGKRGGWQILIG
jgi:hypothetical protein